MNNWCICWLFTHVFTGDLIFKGLTAQRVYKSFCFKGLNRCSKVFQIQDINRNAVDMPHSGICTANNFLWTFVLLKILCTKLRGKLNLSVSVMKHVMNANGRVAIQVHAFLNLWRMVVRDKHQAAYPRKESPATMAQETVRDGRVETLCLRERWPPSYIRNLLEFGLTAFN
jgi:hypothetical protein